MIIEITDITDSRVAEYFALSDTALRHSSLSESGIFIAESPKVIRSALRRGYRPVSLLCERRHIEGDAADIIARFDESIPVYTGSREVLASLTGYTLTRGVLCAMRRRDLPSVADVVEGAGLVAVIDGVCDTTNIGGIFRAAAALGVDAVLLTRGSCDPLNRRSVRVSMGTVFDVPWTWLDTPVASLKEYGFTTMALALKPGSVPLDAPELAQYSRVAVVFGTEGDGLGDEVIAEADYSVIIPMHNGVDSLNVATAASIVFWHFRSKSEYTSNN